MRAFDMNGRILYLDYDMELNSFAVEYYPNGRPSRFSANVRLGNENVLLEVNHPIPTDWGKTLPHRIRRNERQRKQLLHSTGRKTTLEICDGSGYSDDACRSSSFIYKRS